MRGIALVRERLGSQSPCQCGCRHLASESGFRTIRLHPALDSTYQLGYSSSRLTAVAERAFGNTLPRGCKPFGSRNLQTRLALSLSPFRSLSTVRVLEPGGKRESVQELNTLKETFYKIIQQCQPDQVMNALLDPRFKRVVASLPQNTFAEILRLLSPAYFIEPYREIHHAIHPYAARVKGLRPLGMIFSEFEGNLSAIVRIRRQSNYPLGLAEYTHLLDCARSMGNARMACSIFHEMKELGVEPDIQCYNHYLEALVWDSSYTGLEKHRLRMEPYAYYRRRSPHPIPGWCGYGTASRSVKKEVLQLLNEMARDGIPSDEATFVSVFLASARVGYVVGMKRILKTVWNIDIDLVMDRSNPSEHPPVTAYDRTSPLYPTERLLFAIAHGFGTTSDIYTALRVVSFVSRSYDIPISEKVWKELLERAYQLSRPRRSRYAEQLSRGKISPTFFQQLFHTMTSEPHNVRPSLVHCRMMAKVALDQAKFELFEPWIGTAYDIYRETVQKRAAARQVVEQYLDQISAEISSRYNGHEHENHNDGSSLSSSSLLDSPALADAIRVYDILRTLTAQQSILMERIAGFILVYKRWEHFSNQIWERKHIPRLIQEWREFIPESFTYRMCCGRLHFEGRTQRGRRNIRIHDRVPVRMKNDRNTTRIDVDSVGVDVKLEDREMEDDYFWERYMAASASVLDFSRPPLLLLNWGPLDQNGEQV
ncbi:hypothetical protein MPDQ_003298 [Monascus purpureus]|uniref:Uncharacterized protein n=1 Tax=Monascus purpureus TaxID=5098 RepID=A0A507QZ43_MONPU|nr:hypothetical protein MPDQ_003298 [Monascus purpureus]BDD55923.1 hypothetical protein MAP00_001405 [Monascus purpureus]